MIEEMLIMSEDRGVVAVEVMVKELIIEKSRRVSTELINTRESGE